MAETFIHRLVGAAMLDITTYEEIEADRSATLQAFTIVLLSSLAAGIGARASSGAAATLTFFTTTSVMALLTWASFALITFEIGARILPEASTRVNVGELLRTLGFAATPGLIQIFGILPGLAKTVFTIAILWSLAASVVAVRQALDYSSTRRTLAVCGLALLLSLTFALALGLFFGPTLSGHR